MSMLIEVAPLQVRSTVCLPCTLRPDAVSVIWTGVGVGVGVTVGVGVGVGVGLGVGVGVGIGGSLGVSDGPGVGVGPSRSLDFNRSWRAGLKEAYRRSRSHR